MAAVLACGPEAVLSHVSAAALWKMVPDQVDSERVDVTIREKDRGRRPGIRVHRCCIEQDEITHVEDIPMTNAARTLLDLAGQFPARDLEQALARAERQNVIARPELLTLLVRYPGRPGAPALRAMLEIDGSAALTRSTAEERFLAIVRKAQLPMPESNVKLGEHEVDFYWRRERVVVEVDGFAFHSSQRMFENDRRRDAGLTARGLRIMRVTWRQIVDEPEVVLVRVAQTLLR
jgi:very-short-patch-repair endonuclease